jgi:hypothetical protein
MEVVGVNDWIDKLAASDRDRAAQNRTQDELRLHRDKIVEAKAPEFWSALVARLSSDCEKLRKTYPNDLSRHCSLVKSGNDYTLQGSDLPWRILIMHFNPNEHSVDISEGIQESRDSQTRVPSYQIKIMANAHDEVEFVYKNQPYTTPDSLAEQMIRYVCKMGQ